MAAWLNMTFCSYVIRLKLLWLGLPHSQSPYGTVYRTRHLQDKSPIFVHIKCHDLWSLIWSMLFTKQNWPADIIYPAKNATKETKKKSDRWNKTCTIITWTESSIYLALGREAIWIDILQNVLLTAIQFGGFSIRIVRKICKPGEKLSEWEGEHGDLVVRGMLSFQVITADQMPTDCSNNLK